MGHTLTGRAGVRIVRPLKALTETGRGPRAFREPQATDCEPGQAAAATFTREPTGERPTRGVGISSLLRWSRR